MARAASKSKAPAKARSTAVASWKDEMAQEAEVAKGMEKGVGSSTFFSTRGGRLTLNDQQMPNNEMAVIVLDYVLENTYYDQDFDPDSPTSPVCFAFGTDEETMKPHPDAVSPQSDACATCEWNRFGSADRGRGKACRNSRRLALTPAGKIDSDGELQAEEDPEYFETSDVAFLKVPPTSLKGWAAYVREVVGFYKTPPIGVYTHVQVVPDSDDQFHVQFSHAGPISDEVGPVVMQRRQALRDSEQLVQPYQPIQDEADEAPKKKAPRKKKAASRRGRY